MIAYLTGVLEDGTERGPGVPLDPRRFLEFYVGQDVTVKLSVVYSSGRLAKLAGGVLTLSIRRNPLDPVAVVTKTGTLIPAEGAHRGDFSILAADTAQLPPGSYFYDVWLTLGGNNDPVIPTSPLLLNARAK